MEDAAGTSAGKSGPRKTKGTKKKGAKVPAAGTRGAKKPRGKHGLACPTDNGKEKGEWSGEETEQNPTSSRLFQVEHFQRLLTKVISTRNYQMETPEVPRSSASANLDPREFKKPVKVQTFSSFPDYFEDVIQEEWANPGGGTSLLSLARRFYSLPDNTMEDLKVPLIDTPMVALHSGAVMPKDGENALKDAFDRKK
ncbi:UNVERIFIED_CONTAM: hypothetical protein K2H54_059636 [Gekko kuhli]